MNVLLIDVEWISRELTPARSMLPEKWRMFSKEKDKFTKPIIQPYFAEVILFPTSDVIRHRCYKYTNSNCAVFAVGNSCSSVWNSSVSAVNCST